MRITRRPDTQSRAVSHGGNTWWLWAALAVGMLAAAPVWGQSAVPEVVKPPADSPKVDPVPPPATPRGVIVPPATGLGSPAVIQPPATGAMPVIPPPGSPGGDATVVPK